MLKKSLIAGLGLGIALATGAAYAADPVFRAWADTNLSAHRAPGYAIAQISLKAHGQTPGDASAEQIAATKYRPAEMKNSIR